MSHSRKHSGTMLAWAALALLAASPVLTRDGLIRSFIISSEAMAPTLVKGDYVVARLSSDSPHRGDVLFFRQPRDGETPWVKRVICMPGERVQIIDGQVFVNGKAWARRRLPNATEDMGGWERPVFRFEETNADGVKYVLNDYGPNRGRRLMAFVFI